MQQPLRGVDNQYVGNKACCKHSSKLETERLRKVVQPEQVDALVWPDQDCHIRQYGVDAGSDQEHPGA